MLQYAGIAFPNWDITSEGDMGVMLVELFAYALDILSFYGDRLTQECYLPTATQRISILNIAQLLGYTASGGAPATGTVTFQTVNPGVATVVPSGTQLGTAFLASINKPVVYETEGDVTVPQNGGTATVTVKQGITSNMANLGTSTGTAGMIFQIPQPGTEDGSVSVYVSSTFAPTLWQQVKFLVDAGPDDLVYSLFTDENNITNIQFGDGINGVIPGLGLTVFATYTIGAGSAGNQPAGSVGLMLNTIPGVFIPLQPGTTTLYQSSAMDGGSDPETNDQIRANAPAAYATQQRAVSTSDFADLALNVPGVLETSAIANHSTSVTLYILGPNYLPPSGALGAKVLNYFNGKMLAGVTLSIGDPALVPVDIGSVGLPFTVNVKDNYAQATVVSNIEAALSVLLSPPNTSFGQYLTVASIYNTVMSVPGVSYAIINIMTREDVTQSNTNPIQFRPFEIPIVGTFYPTAIGGIPT
jgi:uncharacterized phage protein gp47/JayE